MVNVTVTGAFVVPAGRVTGQAPLPLVFTLSEEDKSTLHVTLAGTTIATALACAVVVWPVAWLWPVAVTVLVTVPTPKEVPVKIGAVAVPGGRFVGKVKVSPRVGSLTCTFVNVIPPQLVTTI